MDNKLDLNLLKDLAKVCRKAGIHTFEGYGYKFELSNLESTKTKSPSAKSKRKKVILQTPDGDIETDAPTEQELLYWSSGGFEEKDAADQ